MDVLLIKDTDKNTPKLLEEYHYRNKKYERNNKSPAIIVIFITASEKETLRTNDTLDPNATHMDGKGRPTVSVENIIKIIETLTNQWENRTHLIITVDIVR